MSDTTQSTGEIAKFVDKKDAATMDTSEKKISLVKADEERTVSPGALDEKKKFSCPYYFGVKSYLHNFYDHTFFRDPKVYEDDDQYQYLLQDGPRRRRRCASIWWKVFVWIGINFLIFGLIGILVGYLVPERTVYLSLDQEHRMKIDKDAFTFNFNLGVCKRVGLVFFCIGGLTLTIALLFPSFFYHYCENGRQDESFRVHIGYDDKPHKSPVEMTVHTTKQVGIQPERKVHESVVTKQGMVSMSE